MFVPLRFPHECELFTGVAFTPHVGSLRRLEKMHQLHSIALIFVIFLQRGAFVDGISCYKCQSVSSSSFCVSDWGSPSVCDKRYCTIYRREYHDPKGVIEKFYRSCEDMPAYFNAIINTADYRDYYRACTSDLCNSGDGVEDFKIEYTDHSPSYVVTGIGSAGEKVSSHYKLIIVTLISFTILLPGQIIQ